MTHASAAGPAVHNNGVAVADAVGILADVAQGEASRSAVVQKFAFNCRIYGLDARRSVGRFGRWLVRFGYWRVCRWGPWRAGQRE